MNIVFVIMGLFGGAVRGLTGYVKYLASYKKVKFEWRYFLMMVGLSGLIGGIAGWMINDIIELSQMNNAYAFLAGYAGGDFFENAFKIIFKKPTLFNLPEILDKSLKSTVK
ncbi:hypothetical protein HGB13_00505 [bacterium]|nr:hypothetical protein [bacterium]